jgi:uncharacterized repeat protein (TIGR03847 family)
MSSSHDLPEVDRITVGTIGPTGQRLFLLQARQGGELVTLKVEKAQVAALSQSLGKMLRELPRPEALPDDLDLEEPADPEWVVGTLGVGYEEETDRIILLAEEVAEDPDAPAGVARFRATREQTAALAIRGTQLVQAGRPPCPLCGYPLDPSGHLCPRSNGRRPPAV